jgi:hypothetical protein
MTLLAFVGRICLGNGIERIASSATGSTCEPGYFWIRQALNAEDAELGAKNAEGEERKRPLHPHPALIKEGEGRSDGACLLVHPLPSAGEGWGEGEENGRPAIRQSNAAFSKSVEAATLSWHPLRSGFLLCVVGGNVPAPWFDRERRRGGSTGSTDAVNG